MGFAYKEINLDWLSPGQVPAITAEGSDLGYVVADMTAAMVIPNLAPARPDYGTWLVEVRTVLRAMRMEMSNWQENWEFDFRKEYDRGLPARDAAVRAHDFWWREILAESWT